MENLNKLTTSDLGVTLVQQSEGLAYPKPVTTSDDIAVEVKVSGSRKTYAGFVSLTEALANISASTSVGQPASKDYSPEIRNEEGEVIQEQVGTAPTGIYAILADFEKRLRILEETDFTTEDVENSDYENI